MTVPIDFNGLDTAVNGPIRLGALTALALDGPLDFTTLKKRLEVSDGAVAPHLPGAGRPHGLEHIPGLFLRRARVSG